MKSILFTFSFAGTRKATVAIFAIKVFQFEKSDYATRYTGTYGSSSCRR